MARTLLAAVVSALLLPPAEALAGDGYHPFRDFGQNTTAPPGPSSTPMPGAPGVPPSGAPVDMGAATGHADPHPYHPFRDFGMNAAAPTPGSPAAGAIAPNYGYSSQSEPVVDSSPREPLVDVKPWDKKDEKEQREDASENFETVVTAYLAREATDEGCWPYREGKGKTMCLTLIAVDGAHAKKVGPGRYAAPAAMAELHGKARPAFRFVVDFSEAEWKVVEAKRLK
jgi:hypothetical protein